MLSVFRHLHVVLDELSDADFLKTPTRAQLLEIFHSGTIIDFEFYRPFHVLYVTCLRKYSTYRNAIVAFLTAEGRKR